MINRFWHRKRKKQSKILITGQCLTHLLPCALQTHKTGVQGAEPPVVFHVEERRFLAVKTKEEGRGFPPMAIKAEMDK